MVVGKARKPEARLGRPILLDAPGCPDFQRSPVGEENAVAKASAVGEPAASGQRPEFWMEALAVKDEDRPVFGEVHRSLQAVRLERCGLFRLLFAASSIGLF